MNTFPMFGPLITRCCLLAGLAASLWADEPPQVSPNASAPIKIAFVAGGPSHGYGAHEHYAGCALLAKELHAVLPQFQGNVHRGGWPSDPGFFEGAAAIVIFADGGEGHPALPHLDFLKERMNAGTGLVCLHYAVEVPKGPPGDAFIKLLGGYFEPNWSVNPHWTPDFQPLPDHPICRGVHPIHLEDEWYYHMRFVPGMEHVTPILSAVPTSDTLSRPDGTHSGNPDVRKEVAAAIPQHVAWAYERPEGGRAFGFTGAHVHWNWGDEMFRRLVLNAIVWCSQNEVPINGVPARIVSQKNLEDNQDEPKP